MLGKGLLRHHPHPEKRVWATVLTRMSRQQKLQLHSSASVALALRIGSLSHVASKTVTLLCPEEWLWWRVTSRKLSAEERNRAPHNAGLEEPFSCRSQGTHGQERMLTPLRSAGAVACVLRIGTWRNVGYWMAFLGSTFLEELGHDGVILLRPRQ